MQNYIKPLPRRTLAPYQCTWKHFRRGWLDWALECAHPAGATSAPEGSSGKFGALALVMALGFVLVLGFVLAQAGPTLAKGAGVLGTQAIATLTAVAAVGSLMAVPVWAGVRFWRFVHAMCHRGWELETGQRAAIRVGV